MFRYRPIVVAVMGLATWNAKAATLGELMASIPAPPTEVSTAVSWTQNGQIVAPEYLKFKQALEAERAATITLNGGPLPETAAAPSLEIADTPEVQNAIRSYGTYLQSNSAPLDPKTVLNKRTRWLQAAMGKQLLEVVDKIKACASTCAQAAYLEGRKQLLAESDLQQFSTLFKDWRKGRASLLSTADQSIAATGNGAKATSAAGKSAIAQYRAAMLKEIDVTLSITELAIKRSDAISSGKIDAYSGASRSKPKT